MNNNKITFGQRFKKLRNDMGLTQGELVKLFNEKYYYSFNTSSISMYENDKQIPEIDVLNKWADFFNCSLDYLIGRADIKNPEDKIEKIEKLAHKEIQSVEDALEIIESQEGLMLKGETLTDEDKILLANALQLGMKYVLDKKKKEKEKEQ
ncbi:helix-turn-helix transcriptional regulator [Tissierella sp.]|uniref:helix-turn-helix domain-containing protein n=1 Tax=Tissierella sp. TaxID=41274 RepID=UPI0030317567